ncbi:MASE1 domain-containing protein, partial [Escherichia coli]|uniref:MASE1 domain-containing protein n=4 Tax=Escherichia coli TaxID=562 RepID=UPI002077029C
MKLNATYIKIRDKWWGLPLFLPSLILPIFAHINTFAHISSGEVFLFYLPLALMISMMMFFSWAALPGITLGIFVRKYAELGFYETLSLTANFIIIIILCWGGYRVFTGFAPIFPDICYHLTHYKPAAADIPVASDNQ